SPGLSGVASLAVTPAAASRLLVANFPSPSASGSAHGLTVTALDPYGNVASSYTGTDHFTSSDAAAVLPADYSFTTADAGSHTFSAWLMTSGTQSIAVTDLGTGLALVLATFTVSNAQTYVLQVAGYPSVTTAGVAQSFTVAERDANGN